MQEQMQKFLEELRIPSWAGNLIIIGLSLLLGLLIKVILSLLVRKRVEERTGKHGYSFSHSMVKRLGFPLNVFFPLFLFNALLPAMQIAPTLLYKLSQLVEVVLIVCFSWMLIRCIKIAQDYGLYRFDIHSSSDNLRMRKVRTQLQFIRKLLIGIILVLTLAAILLNFHSLRKVGTGLLTGVGLGGIILGFAAQKSIGNLLAGFQIAFTQPIRIDDVIIAEGEWGVIEEITLTYVVVKIWDERRLVLPINYFLEKPFQNWTRTNAELLGFVIFFADYTLPIDQIRTELTRLLEASKLWDGRVNIVQVTGATETTIEVRALMSGRNSNELFDLRCYVRENLIKFIDENFARSLPKRRTLVEGGIEERIQNAENRIQDTEERIQNTENRIQGTNT